MPNAAVMQSLPALFVRTVVTRDWRFLGVTVISCMVAATVATFQVSVYNSFRRASAVVPRALGADFWVKARSVECFDFPAPFAEDYAGSLARYFPGARMERVVFGFVPWRSPTGTRGNVALVGVEGFGITPLGFVANRSDLPRLNIADRPGRVDASIGNETFSLEGTVGNLATYLGAPYVLTDFETARRLLRMDPASTAFLAGRFAGPAPEGFDRLSALAARRFPEVEAVSAANFADSSMAYWQRKTGAGLAIGLAALLALLLMMILFTNGVLRFIQRYYSDLLSLLGHGASKHEIAVIVAGVAAAIAMATLAGSALVTPLIVAGFRPLLPWVAFTGTDLLAPLLSTALAMGFALISARGAIAEIGPEAVFRT